MSELTPAGGGPNRTFIVIAAGLVGLILLGAVAVGGIVLIPRMLQPAATPTIRIAAVTPTRPLPTPTFPPPPPTEVPTQTPVLAPATVAPLSTVLPVTTTLVTTGTVTKTVTTGTPGTPGVGPMPPTGLGEDLLLLAGGIVLVLVIFAARRARTSGV
jgi:hypothetical protein